MFFKSDLIFLCFLTLITADGIDYLSNDARLSRFHRLKRQEEDKCPDGKFECSYGQCINGLNVCDGITNCNNGIDEKDETCSNFSSNTTCELKRTVNMRVRCEFKGVQMQNCGERIAPWTTIKVGCNDGYVPKDSSKWFDTNKCLETGKWLHPMSTCKYGCGKPTLYNLEGSDGNLIQNSYHPWNAIIYRREYGEYVPHCFGTLITPFSVVTDVGCTRTEDGKDVRAEDVKIGLGKFEIKFVSQKGHPQFIDVSLIKRDLTYYDSDNSEDSSAGPNGRTKRNPSPAQTLVNPFVGPPRATVRIPGALNSAPLVANTVEFNQAIFSLRTQSNLTAFVMPVCIDTDCKCNFDKSSVGSVITWKGKNGTVTVQDVQILSSDKCSEHLANDTSDTEAAHQKLGKDEFCALYKNCAADCSDVKLKRGTGITLSIDGKRFLVGVYKRTIFAEDQPGKIGDTILVFSDVRGTKNADQKTRRNIIKEDIKFTERYRHSNVPEGKCSVPYVEGTTYTALPCFGNHPCYPLQTYEVMDKLSIMFVKCKDKYVKTGQCGYKLCVNGMWLPNDTSCVRLCEPFKTLKSVSTSCLYEGKNVSCEENVRAGTIATSNCQTGDWDTDLIQYNNSCLDTGKWQDSPQIFAALCTDHCGKIKKVENTSVASTGGDINSSEFPWNVALYWKKGTKIEHICGGTLITKFAVLTAAHCVFDSYDERLASHVLKVGLGKLYKGFKDQRDGHAQYRDVVKVYTPEAYNGKTSAYIFDISILELKEAVDINDVILPACIDTTKKFALKTRDSSGSVVGWGSDVDGDKTQQTDKIRKVVLPYIDKDTCWRDYKEKFSLRLTNDKFCAFNLRDTTRNVDKGDSGSGLTFKLNDRYYVYGVVSTQSHNQVSMFTNVTFPDHLEFINNKLERILENNKRK